MKKNTFLLQLLVPLTYILMVTVNALANALPINGKGTGEISDSYADLFAPAGITFAIWGLIYLLLAVFVVYFVIELRKGAEKEDRLIQIGWLFVLSSIANTVWIFAWHYEIIGASLLLMLVILYSLIQTNRLLIKAPYSLKERICLRIPFGVYFGWITVATIANVVTFLVAINWGAFSIPEVIWTDMIIIIGAGIGFVAILVYKNAAYGFTIIWAYGGIIIKHLSSSQFNKAYPSVIVSAILSILLLILGEILLLRVSRIKKADR